MLELLRARTKNMLTQALEPGRKIFLIGPHRCATTTLHMFFRGHALRSLHWRHGETFLAKEIDVRKNDRQALRAFMNRWTVFSDFVHLTHAEHIENHTMFRLFESIYPDAYFILNDRDVDRWVVSRLRHRDGRWLGRYLDVHGGTREEAVEKWKWAFLAHRQDVLDHFRGKPNFLHLEIDKDDKAALVHSTQISTLVEFLKPHFILLESRWRSYNTKRRTPHTSSAPAAPHESRPGQA